MAIDNLNTGKEIIDATRNAVIEAAENVSNIIEEHDAAAHHEVFYQSAEFWVAAAFVLVVILLARPISKIIMKMINDNIADIKERIQESVNLQSEAQKLLASYERKFQNVNEEADTILKRSQNEIDYMRKAALSKLEQEMKQREAEVEERLQAAKDKASSEISQFAGSLSIKAVKKALHDSLTAKDLSKLIDTSLQNLEKL